MRKIVLDTETTGLSSDNGDRIIEIGCVEIINRQVTENYFHTYINPERDIPPEAFAIHGLSTEFLSDKPKFSDIAEAFCKYIKDAEVVIHNAPFDLGFLNAEFKRIGLPEFSGHVKSVFDTLPYARELFPGRRNSLDALCERYEIPNTHRTLHGGLLDAKLLADVYLLMTRGQDTLGIDRRENKYAFLQKERDSGNFTFPPVHVLHASEDELKEHELILSGMEKQMKQPPVWRNQSS